MEKESIKMFFESQSTPPDSEKIEQWYIDNINNRIGYHPSGIIEKMYPSR